MHIVRSGVIHLFFDINVLSTIFRISIIVDFVVMGITGFIMQPYWHYKDPYEK